MNLKLIIIVASFIFTGILAISNTVSSEMLTLHDSELWDNSEFGGVRYGPATFTRDNPAGEGVIFNFTGLSSSATGVSDNYPVSDIGQIMPSHGNGDFSNFNTYEMLVTNLDNQIVSFSLYLNTGFTGPSGTPSNDWTNDTFWQSPWVNINPGEETHVIFDFTNAIPWGIGDNKAPHTQGSDGVATVINSFDHSEISNIGFQVAYISGVNPDASILVSVAPEPISSTLFLVGAATLGFRRFRKNMKE